MYRKDDISVIQSIRVAGCGEVAVLAISCISETETFGEVAFAKMARSTRVSFIERDISIRLIFVSLPSLISKFTNLTLTYC